MNNIEIPKNYIPKLEMNKEEAEVKNDSINGTRG